MKITVKELKQIIRETIRLDEESWIVDDPVTRTKLADPTKSSWKAADQIDRTLGDLELEVADLAKIVDLMGIATNNSQQFTRVLWVTNSLKRMRGELRTPHTSEVPVWKLGRGKHTYDGARDELLESMTGLNRVMRMIMGILDKNPTQEVQRLGVQALEQFHTVFATFRRLSYALSADYMLKVSNENLQALFDFKEGHRGR